jgi:hypothetical protein
MLLWDVLIEDPSRGTLDRVLLVAADKPEDAEAIVRAHYSTGGRDMSAFQLSAQPVTEVSGPAGSLYRVSLRRLSTRR